MAEKILKSPDNKIWTYDNKIVKSRPFSETIIQDGLAFWGSADINYLTLVDGLVSEAYDIRGNGNKMIQNTVANRFNYETVDNIGYLRSTTNIYPSLSITNQNVKSLFLVAYNNPFGAFLGNFITIFGYTPMFTVLAMYYYNYNITVGSYDTFYKNNTKYVNVQAPVTNTLTISSSVTNYNKLNTTMYLWKYNNASTNVKIKEWGWYNRLLNESEIIHNINALNTKNQIF